MNVNPYESPRESQPLAQEKVKRAIGVGTILLLTPIAVLIALGGSCLASMAVVDFIADLGTAVVVGLTVFLLPPALVLLAMIWWAVQASRRARQERDLKRLQLLKELP